MDGRAQVSAEMIIVIAAVLAVALIFIKNFSATALKGSQKMVNKTEELLAEIDKIK